LISANCHKSDKKFINNRLFGDLLAALIKSGKISDQIKIQDEKIDLKPIFDKGFPSKLEIN